MNNYFKFLRTALFATGLIIGLTGCDNTPELFETPPWLGGSSIETLEKRGNYTNFLRLMERANYTEPVTKQLFTLFAPNDSAFDAYLQSVGKSSVEDFTQDEAVQLFTLHVLRNPLSRYYLIYEFVWNEFQGPKGEYASLFHRKVTPSTSIPYSETIRYIPGREGEILTIYTGTKNVPLWSDEFWTDFGGKMDGSDYTFMYPGSSWKKGYGLDENGQPLKGLNWHNAMVIPNPEKPDELEVRTASGFIYFIDRVVPPIPSMEEYLRNNENYSLFYDLMQRFAAYNTKKTDKSGVIMWRKSYSLIFDLANEYGPEAPPKPKRMFSGFIPSNAVLQNYLDTTILKYYPTINDVPEVTLFYIIQSQLSEALVLISKMEQNYFNPFGDEIEINKSDLTSGYMTSNGAVYESKKVFEPNVFTTVPGDLFFNKDYSVLLSALSQTNMLATLSNPNEDVTLFATTNEALEVYGIRYDEIKSQIEWRGTVDGKWTKMETNDLTFFAQDQIIKDAYGDFSGSGGYIETSSGNYIQYTDNQVAASENNSTGNTANVTGTDPQQNGFLVKVDKPIESRFTFGHLLMADDDLSEFRFLLADAKLLDTAAVHPNKTGELWPNLKFISSAKYWTAFLPDNEAMAKARQDGLIPVKYPTAAAKKDSVNSFIMYHFVKNDVVFDDGLKSGTFTTNRTYKDTIEVKLVLNSKLEIINSPENLSVLDLSGQTVSVEHSTANVLVRKGVAHKIKTALKYY